MAAVGAVESSETTSRNDILLAIVELDIHLNYKYIFVMYAWDAVRRLPVLSVSAYGRETLHELSHM